MLFTVYKIMDKVRRLRNPLSLIKHVTYFEQDSSPRVGCAKNTCAEPGITIKDTVWLWKQDS